MQNNVPFRFQTSTKLSWGLPIDESKALASKPKVERNTSYVLHSNNLNHLAITVSTYKTNFVGNILCKYSSLNIYLNYINIWFSPALSTKKKLKWLKFSKLKCVHHWTVCDTWAVELHIAQVIMAISSINLCCFFCNKLVNKLLKSIPSFLLMLIQQGTKKKS